MLALRSVVDDFLRGRERFATDAPARARLAWLLAFVVVFGGGYGVMMGTFSGLGAGRWPQLVYSGVKVPLLLLATFGLCLPTFFVLNTVAGLRDDFGQALSAVIATQAGAAVVLAALAPLTALCYLSCANYPTALLWNLLMFGVASIAAQRVLRRYYRPLIARNRLHRSMLLAWFVLYGFVGVQTAWVLRPFVGAPHLAVTFFREGAWGNAYLVVARLIGRLLGG